MPELSIARDLQSFRPLSEGNDVSIPRRSKEVDALLFSSRFHKSVGNVSPSCGSFCPSASPDRRQKDTLLEVMGVDCFTHRHG